MKLVLVLLVVTAAAEVVFYGVRALWAARHVVVPVLASATAFGSAALVALRPNVMSALVALASGYRIFNDVRVVEGRMHEQYLRRSTRRTSWRLIVLQVALGGLWWLWHRYDLATHPLWVLLTAAQLFAAIILLASTMRTLKRTMPRLDTKHYSDAQLPSLSVAIPARNETDDLEACLHTIIASDYPKLEILVLDDCSQTNRTPEIIRSFAHDGVRFVQGEPPVDTWLPKNQAYRRLVGEASGEYVLFAGVDVRLAPDSLRKLMTTLLDRHKTMISVLPQPAQSPAAPRGTLVQAMRFWWEQAPPRRLFRRPPVLSTCWLVNKQALQKVGGFEAARRSIVPEAYLAKQFTRQDGYSFVRSDDVLGITTVKQPSEQRATAVRMRYPQLHRRPEQVLVVSAAEFGFLLLPFVIAAAGWLWHIGSVAHMLSILATLVLVVAYWLMARATALSSQWTAPVSFPAMIVLDLGLLHYSMYKYEFSEVLWKARNICIPAMHVVPHLPKLK